MRSEERAEPGKGFALDLNLSLAFSLVFTALVLLAPPVLVAQGEAMQAGATQAEPTQTVQRQVTPLVADLLHDPQLDLPGLQVVLVSPRGQYFLSWGSVSYRQQQAPQPEMIYEIASLSKTFAATLLAQAVLQGRLALEEPLEPCVSGKDSALCYQGLAVSWLDLATHHGALPALPDNLDWQKRHPTRAYRRQKLEAFLAHFTLSAPPGQRFHYSTLGYGILGNALAERYGQDFATVLKEQILQPLNLQDSAVFLSAEQKEREVWGYRGHQPIPPAQDWGGLTASGGLKASVYDLALWLVFQAGLQDNALAEAIALTHRVTERQGAPFCRMALGWQYYQPKGWYWHSGTATGFKSFMAFDPEQHFGVLLISNKQVQGFKFEPVGLRLMTYLAEQVKQKEVD